VTTEPSRSELLQRIAKLEARLAAYESAEVEFATASDQIDEANRESEHRFQTIATTAPVMIWMSGLDKGCTFVNEPWLDFKGRRIEQQLGEGWLASVHPDDLQHCIGTYSAAFDNRTPFRMEYRVRRADGEYRWILDTGIPRYQDGEFAGYIGSCIDITERVLAEHGLRASELQLKDAQRLANIGSFEAHIPTGAVHWSHEMLRICGLPDDLQPEPGTCSNYVYPADLHIYSEAREKALAGTESVDAEFRVLRPSGEVRFVRSKMQTIAGDRGEPLRLIGALQDITDQVLAQARLRDSEERLKRAELLAQIGSWSHDLVTGGQVWSDGECRIFGTAPGNAPAYSEFLDAVVPEDRARVEKWGAECTAGTNVRPLELRIRRPGGEVRTIISTPEVELGENGQPARIFGATLDVTDLRRAQHELFASQKLESIGTLASGIAHDFNNLLGSVLAQADLAVSEIAAGSSPVDHLQRIRSVAMRGAEVVRELMIYAGQENGGAGLVDLSQVVADMLELLRVSISKHARLETELAKDLPSVHASAAQVRQVVLNLVTNASEAMGARDGVIRIATRMAGPGAHDATEHRGIPVGECLQFEVADTGCGMSPETQARAFDPFFSTKQAGHGLGLAVVQGIVRGLGGSVQIESELNRGSTVRVTLPVGAQTATERSDAPPINAGTALAAGNAGVLVVEDEIVLRQAVATMLRKQGFEVHEASDGCSAVQLLREEAGDIDVMLLDMTIPGCSSQEVLDEAARSRPACKVLLTSAYTEEMVRAAVTGPAVQGFIRKPFRLANLVHNVRALLPAAH
jgi:PAS domain S-box-containing protein